jgi:hypothetical protein
VPEKHVVSRDSSFKNRFNLALEQNNKLVPAIFLINIQRYRNRDSAIGMANGYGLDDRGVGVLVPVRARLYSTSFRHVLGPTQPPVQ